MQDRVRTVRVIVSLLVASAGAVDCVDPLKDFTGYRCDNGRCLDGYECNPLDQICVTELERGCDGGSDAVCWSRTSEGDVCLVDGSFLPCGPEEDCIRGCRVCEDGYWSSCRGADCQLGTLLDCNSCGDACDVQNAGAFCDIGRQPFRCDYNACDAGFIDFDGDRRNGCECGPLEAEVCDGTDNDCNGLVDDISTSAVAADCDSQISNANVQAWECVGGCVITTCDNTWYDADGDVSNGCEYQCNPTVSGAETCDGEDNDCNDAIDDVANIDADCGGQYSGAVNVAAWRCDAGACAIDACAANWVGTDPTTGCDTPCTVTGAESCNGADDDCNGSVDDVDQTALDSACGGSFTGAVAVASWDCVAGACAIGVCVADNHDIDGLVATGCEYPCQATGVETCDGSDNDCDDAIDAADTGYDVDVDCATACTSGCGPITGWACNGGACEIAACDGTAADLDNLPATGCECPLSPEICDGVDNDCDNDIDAADADFDATADCGGRVCTSNCAAVSGWACGGGLCTTTGCNGSAVDQDGLPANGCECTGSAEICDGTDNDCDNLIDTADSDLDVDADCGGRCSGTGCTTVAGWACNGACEVTGCNGGTFDANSDPADGCECFSTGPETCNNRDDNCDGQVDEGVANCACSSGPPKSVEDCANGIDDDCDGFIDNCMIDPSNLGSPDLCANAADLDIATDTSLNTQSGVIGVTSYTAPIFTTVAQSGAPEIAVFVFNSIRIRSGARLTVTGGRALALIACTNITIEGTLDACASGQTGGPGASNGGNAQASGSGTGAGGPGGATGDPSWRRAGGGGASYCSSGDAGGDAGATSGGTTGPTYGNLAIMPLVGGSGGGGGGGATLGGGGGGAVQLAANGTISITGQLNACGAGGPLAPNGGGGGGAGSGGAILLEAGAVVVGVGGVVAANGGGGSGGSDYNGSADNTMGEDGQPSAMRAAGGSGSSAPAGGDGGRGGAGSGGNIAGEPGQSIPGDSSQGGGGGAGVGWIRINTPLGAGGITLDGVVSPSDSACWSVGTVSYQ